MEDNKRRFIKNLTWAGYATGAVGVGYFLWIHQAHAAQYIPFLLLLACPLAHLLGGHGHDHSKCGSKEKNKLI